MMRKYKIFCFDLDNIICLTKNSDYEASTPNMEAIKVINLLKKRGNKIIIFTARYMGRNKENSKLVNKKYLKKTQKILIDWGLKFDKLLMGKPSYDIFVDDKYFDHKKNWIKKFKKKYL